MANYISSDGAKKLAAELNQLVSTERPRIVQEVQEAAAQGDRSENAEYIYGKKRLREIDRRIRFLMKRLDSAVVVALGEVEHAEVRFGARVEVMDENEQRRVYHIVGTDEADPGLGKISYESPMGRALMKKRVGDQITVHRPAGEIELEIVSVSYQE